MVRCCGGEMHNICLILCIILLRIGGKKGGGGQQGCGGRRYPGAVSLVLVTLMSGEDMAHDVRLLFCHKLLRSNIIYCILLKQ